MNQRRFTMMTAGPVNISDTVKRSMIYPEIGHREPEFSDLLRSIQKKLLPVFRANSEEYAALVINGSGTNGMEAVLVHSVHDGKEVLVISNGAFGERMAEICETYRLPLIRLSYKWGESIKLRDVESVLDNNPNLETVAMIFLETSTGMSNPVHDIGALCREYDKLFVVDAVSGLAGDPLTVVDDNIDFCFSNTNKCIGAYPALSFVSVKHSSFKRISDIKPRNYCLDLLKHYDYEHYKAQTPFTPQIPLFYMLNQALTELLEEGIDTRIERYRQNSILIRERLARIGFRFQLNPENMSNVMTNVLIPQRFKYDFFHSGLKERGYIIYPGKGPLDGIVMHIANVGTLNTDDIAVFCDNFEEVLGGRKVEY